MATECCAPRHCACGAVIEKYYTACETCRERNRLQRATVIQPQDWIDPVQSDDVGGEWGEGYSSSIEAMRECCDECGYQTPAYCWPCEPLAFELDAESILERAIEKHHEDAADRIVDADGLYDFIEAWNAKQSLVTYYPDHTRVIVLDAERFAALIDGERGNG